MTRIRLLPVRSRIALQHEIVGALARSGIQRTPTDVKPFADELARQIRSANYLQSLPANDEGAQKSMNIRAFIIHARDSGELDEALWRAFLAAHFGAMSASNSAIAGSAGKFLCAFGQAPTWTWENVSSDVPSFNGDLESCQEELKSLRFGNHRKFESKQPDALAQVIESFICWVRLHGSSPSAAFAPLHDDTHEQAFHDLYRRFDVCRFGRLGKFDLLCLIGELKLANIAPDSCYLVDSTGPLAGAKKLCGPQAAGLSDQKLSDAMDGVARDLQLPYAVMENALCIWQKKPQSQVNGLPQDEVPHSAFIPLESIGHAVIHT